MFVFIIFFSYFVFSYRKKIKKLMKIRNLINATLSEIGIKYKFVNTEIYSDIKYYNYTILTDNKKYSVLFDSELESREDIIKTLIYSIGQSGYTRGKEDLSDDILLKTRDSKKLKPITDMLIENRQTELFSMII